MCDEIISFIDMVALPYELITTPRTVMELERIVLARLLMPSSPILDGVPSGLGLPYIFPRIAVVFIIVSLVPNHVWRRALTNIQTDQERLLSPFGLVTRSQHLACAHQGRSTLELLYRQ